MDWAKLWNDIVTFFKDNVWNIILFFAVLFIGIIVIKIFMNILKRVLNKTKLEKIAIGFVCSILKVALYLVLVLVLLSIMGIEISGILTALSALVLAVGMALQNLIANVANGIVIVSGKMFKKGDYIEVEGFSGSITKINFLHTTIMTPDNKKITLPNSMIINNAVINYDSNFTRRLQFNISVAYESDVEVVKKIILDCMISNGKVLLDPAPFCRMNSMDASSIGFIGRCWCDKEDYWDVYYDVLETIFNELKRNNISIPFNQLEIRERKDTPQIPVNGTGLAQRVEKVRQERYEFDLENVSFSDIVKQTKKRR